MEPTSHRLTLKGTFETTDATPSTLAMDNPIALLFPGEEGVIRVSCKVVAFNKAFAGSDYYFGSETIYVYNQHGANAFEQIDSSSDTTYSEVAASALSFTLNDDNDVITMSYTGEAGETFVWEYEAEIEFFGGSLQEWLDLYLTFQIFDGLSGTANLSESIEVNGTTVSPVFIYDGGDANGTNWVHRNYGETITLQAGTAPTYNDGSPCLGDDDDSVKFNAGGYYKASGNSFADITTEDFVIEFIAKISGSGDYFIIDKRIGVTEGWRVGWDSGSTEFRLYLEDSSSNIAVIDSASLEVGVWYHVVFCVNRDEASAYGGTCFINGVKSGGGDDPSAVGSITSAIPLTIGAQTDGTDNFDGNIAYTAMWKQVDLFSSGSQGEAQAANLAANRFAQVSGRYPQVFTHDDVIVDGDMEAVGVGDWTATNITLSKDSTAPLQEGTQHLRLTYLATSDGYAEQTIQIVGSKYRATGYARSDGTGIPKVSEVGATHWTGTNSTSWQAFDVTYVALTTDFRLQGGTLSAGVYVEFDDVTVTRVDELPIVATRAYSAYLDKVESGVRKLYLVGSEWLRQCHRNDGTNDIYGYLGEQQSKNEVPYSEEIDNAAWTKTQCTISADAIAAPNKKTTADGMISSSVAGNHTINDGVSTSSGTDTFSFWAKKGASVYDWVRGYITTVAASCFFDLDAGVVGTDTNCTGYIEDWGDGWYRCIMVLTGDGAVRNAYIYSAEADGDASFTGDDATIDTYVWGIQYEQGIDYASSYIPTSGGTATRLKDQLRHKGDDGNVENNQQGTIVADIMLEDYDAANNKLIYSINDGGASADRIYGALYAATDVYAAYTAATAGNAGISTAIGDIVDGSIHSIRMAWETDNLVAYRDGVPDASPDTSCDIPDDLDRIEIGASYALGSQFSGLIQNLRIYNIPTSKG